MISASIRRARDAARVGTTTNFAFRDDAALGEYAGYEMLTPKVSVPSSPSSMDAPFIASAAARSDRPRSKIATWAPMKRRNGKASNDSRTDLPQAFRWAADTT